MRAYAQLQHGGDITGLARGLAANTALGDAIAHGDRTATARTVAAVAHGHLTRLQIARNGRLIASAGRAPSLAPVTGVLHDSAGSAVAEFALSKLTNLYYAQLAAHLANAQVRISVPGDPSAARAANAGAAATASTFSFVGEAFPSGTLRVTLRIPPAGSLCGSDASTTRANVIAGVAQRIYGAEAHSLAVRSAVKAIASYRPLIDAVVRNDARATRAAVTALVYNHSHIVRLRVMRGSQLLSDIGGPVVLAPSTGTLRDASGAVVGQFVMSLQDDLGFRLLTNRFTAAHSVLRIGDRVVQGAISGAPSPLPDHGAITIGGVRYHLVSFQAQAFPSGPLRVTLMVRAAA
jgi:hypothetical protein